MKRQGKSRKGVVTWRPCMIPNTSSLWLRSSSGHYNGTPCCGRGVPRAGVGALTLRGWETAVLCRFRNRKLTPGHASFTYLYTPALFPRVTATFSPCLFLNSLPLPTSHQGPTPTLLPKGHSEKHWSCQCSAPEKRTHGQVRLGNVACPMLLLEILNAHCHV